MANAFPKNKGGAKSLQKTLHSVRCSANDNNYKRKMKHDNYSILTYMHASKRVVRQNYSILVNLQVKGAFIHANPYAVELFWFYS